MLKIKKLILIVALLDLAGCASYGNMVNSFAPPKQKSAVNLASAEEAQALETEGGKSPFCEVPPPPPPPPKITEVYMVMPEGGGKVGTVSVIFNDGKEVLMHGDYSAVSLAGEEKKSFVGNQEQLNNLFGAAISALPPAPMSAMLFFVLGKDELTPESKLEAEKVYADFVSRKAPEIWIIGHTDTVGNHTKNDALSLKRAEVVRKNLIKLGVPAESIQIKGMGKRELLVKTPDNKKEPKNRRVEISVR